MTPLPALAAALALAAQTPSAQTPPAEPPCLTRGEFTALARYMLPTLVEGAAAKCRPSLPKDAFLVRESKGLAKYYREAPQPDAATVDRAITKLGIADKLGLLATEGLGPVVAPALGEQLIGRLGERDCGVASGLLELIATLPIEDLSLAVGFLSELGQDDFQAGPIRICRSAR